MRSTIRTKILSRAGQCVAAGALTAGLAFGAAPIASADREWDIEMYDNCMAKTIRNIIDCCVMSGGEPSGTSDNGACHAPPAEQSGLGPTAPAKPGFTLPPRAPGNYSLG